MKSTTGVKVAQWVASVVIAIGAAVGTVEASRHLPELVYKPTAQVTTIDRGIRGCAGAERALSPDYAPDREDLTRIGNDAAASSHSAVADAGSRLALAAEVDDGDAILSAVIKLSQACRTIGY